MPQELIMGHCSQLQINVSIEIEFNESIYNTR